MRSSVFELHYPDGTIRKREQGVTLPKEYRTILELASQRVHTMLVGPAGCGKSFLAEQVAEDLNLKFYAVSCSAGMSEAMLAGWLLPTGKAGAFQYEPSPFVTAYENGGVFLFDEIDSADPNTLTFINSALSNGGMFVPQRLGKPFVKRHKDFVCIAAANTFGNGADMVYVGRNQLDGATLDRFRAGMVTLDYDEEVERALCDEEILRWGWALRRRMRESGLRRFMSMRFMIEMSKMKREYNWGRDLWEQRFFADWTADEKATVGISRN